MRSFLFQAEDGIRDLVRSRGLGDVYKRQERVSPINIPLETVRTFGSTMRQMGSGLMSLVRGSTSLGDVAGPIGMGQLTSEIISRSAMPLWVTLTNLTIILSLLALIHIRRCRRAI